MKPQVLITVPFGALSVLALAVNRVFPDEFPDECWCTTTYVVTRVVPLTTTYVMTRVIPASADDSSSKALPVSEMSNQPSLDSSSSLFFPPGAQENEDASNVDTTSTRRDDAPNFISTSIQTQQTEISRQPSSESDGLSSLTSSIESEGEIPPGTTSLPASTSASVATESASTSSSVVNPEGQSVIFLVSLTTETEERGLGRRDLGGFLGSGQVDICTFASVFNLASDQLLDNGVPIYYSGEEYKPLRGQGSPPAGSTTTTFAAFGESLGFRNSLLPGGEAGFCQDSLDGQVYMTFSSTPLGCSPITLTTYRLEQCQNGQIVGTGASSSTRSNEPTVSTNLSMEPSSSVLPPTFVSLSTTSGLTIVDSTALPSTTSETASSSKLSDLTDSTIISSSGISSASSAASSSLDIKPEDFSSSSASDDTANPTAAASSTTTFSSELSHDTETMSSTSPSDKETTTTAISGTTSSVTLADTSSASSEEKTSIVDIATSSTTSSQATTTSDSTSTSTDTSTIDPATLTSTDTSTTESETSTSTDTLTTDSVISTSEGTSTTDSAMSTTLPSCEEGVGGTDGSPPLYVRTADCKELNVVTVSSYEVTVTIERREVVVRIPTALPTGRKPPRPRQHVARAEDNPRATTIFPTFIPPYASYCPSPEEYYSACAEAGVTQSTTTVYTYGDGNRDH
ncbi:hypothetical protein FZEAL_9471 [Fusarium zealandicum]|uniref:DUF7908 domain-containing protein n=1 Tax=Fusarium zealandicum TaxID=1053134 RepID=A0A8H4UB00_9HYPO|nr:hypothetical protein FZEAL_9471 [Fusarium zealandicum]